MAANSHCIPGLKVRNSFLFLKNKILWKETTGMFGFQAGLENFSFSLLPSDVDLKDYNLKQRLPKL